MVVKRKLSVASCATVGAVKLTVEEFREMSVTLGTAGSVSVWVQTVLVSAASTPSLSFPESNTSARERTVTATGSAPAAEDGLKPMTLAIAVGGVWDWLPTSLPPQPASNSAGKIAAAQLELPVMRRPNMCIADSPKTLRIRRVCRR